jgi:hypothetical protein
MQSVTARVDAYGKLDFACSDRDDAPSIGEPSGSAAPNAATGESNVHDR